MNHHNIYKQMAKVELAYRWYKRLYSLIDETLITEANRLNISSLLINNLLTRLLLFERRIQKLISFPFGSSLYLVAYKLKVK